MKRALVFFFLITCTAAAQTLPGKANLSILPLQKYLVGYYPFDGDANDYSGGNYHGTVFGAALDNDRFGNPNSAYNFSGSQYIDFLIDSTAWRDYTIMGWNFINFGQGNISQNRHILSIGGNSEGVGFIQYPPGMGLQYEQGIYFANFLPPSEFGEHQGFSHGASFGTSMWRHYTLVVDSTNKSVRYSLNGQQLASFTSPGYVHINLANKEYKVGCRFDNQYYFNGKVDDIRMYKRALKPCEIKNLYGESNCTDSVCSEDKASVYHVSSLNATSFTWSMNPASAGSLLVQGDSCIISWTGTYSGLVELIAAGVNAAGTGISDTLNVLVTPKPGTPVITVQSDTLFSSSAVGNQWLLNGVVIPGAVNSTYIVTQSGQYSVYITINGCRSNTSAQVNVVLTSLLEYPDIDFMVYPNPSSGVFFVESAGTDLHTVLTDMYGCKLYEDFHSPSRNSIDLSEEPNGVYFLRITSRAGSVTKKIVKR